MDPNIDHIFETFPHLETSNLYLRQIVPADADALFEIFADDAVTQYYDLYTYTELEEAQAMIEFFAESFEVERAIRWGIARKEDNLLLGTCGYMWLRPYRGEISYELGRPYWRQGIMREALNAIIAFGFEQLALNRVEAMVMVENVASAALLRSLGFTEEGILREHDFFKEAFHDMRCFSLLKREFSQAPSQQ